MGLKGLAHKIIGKAQAGVGMDGPQLFMVMRGKIHDNQPSTDGQCANGLGNDGFGILRIMQHLMEHDRIKCTVLNWQHIEIAKLDLNFLQQRRRLD